MTRSFEESGVYVGKIVERSVEEPSHADDIYYTIEILMDTGVVRFEGVIPQKESRWSEVAELDLTPFAIGQRVVVGVSRFGSEEYIDIMTEEKPHMGPCSEVSP